MSGRRLPVRPDLAQLKHQAKDLLRAIRNRESHALAELQQFHPTPPSPGDAKLADAQLVLARSYQAPSWPRLVLACKLVDAIWKDEPEVVRALVLQHPYLLREHATIRNSNWGPPLSYAANLGRDRVIELLRDLGATDLMHALDRAVLQSQIGTARKLHAWLGAPRPPADALSSPAYTLSASGTALLFEFGAQLIDEHGRPCAPVHVVLESDSRKPEAKHQILEMYAAHGFVLPDTPMMALHRGRIDLLDAHLRRDPRLLHRTFAYAEIFPPELRCGEEALPRTTLDGATLLHVCVEFDELEIARWLLDRGMAADQPAALDARGFGGHTSLFGAVVSFPNFWTKDAAFARLLLDRGADPNARASLREQVWLDDRRAVREHQGLTPLAWGEVFHNKRIVSGPAMHLIVERGGVALAGD